MINIYKIYHQDNPVIAYVGQTKHHIEVRLAQHWIDRNKTPTCGIGLFMREAPFQEFKIELLEVCDKEDSRDREQYWINEIGVLNIQNAVKDPNYNKTYSKNRGHCTRNPVVHNEQEKTRYHKNKDIILTKLMVERVVCECGIEVRKQHLKRHIASSNHVIN